MTHPIKDCPSCGTKSGMQVISSRPAADSIVRQRRCCQCGHAGQSVEFEAVMAEGVRPGRRRNDEPLKPPLAQTVVLKAGDITPADLQVLDLTISGLNALGMEFHPSHRIFRLREMFATALRMQGLTP